MKQEDRAGGGGVKYDETGDERQNGKRKTRWGEVRGEGPVIEEGVRGTLCTGDQ